MNTKTHYKVLRNPNYIGGWDLIDADKTVTIAKVTKEMVHDGKGGESECCTIHFAECKPMVANATNLKRIAKLHNSPFIEEWIGKQIVLTTEKVRAFGEVHDAVRVSTKPATKPTMTADTLAKAKAAIAAGSVTLDAIKKKYTLTAEMEAELTNG